MGSGRRQPGVCGASRASHCWYHAIPYRTAYRRSRGRTLHEQILDSIEPRRAGKQWEDPVSRRSEKTSPRSLLEPSSREKRILTVYWCQPGTRQGVDSPRICRGSEISLPLSDG